MSHQRLSCADPEEGGGPDPPEKSQNIEFSSDTGPHPLKIAATKPTFNVGPSPARQRNVILWRFAAWPMMARLKLYLDPPSPHQLKKRCQS